MAKVRDCEFEPQPCYYVHFWASTFGKVSLLAMFFYKGGLGIK